MEVEGKLLPKTLYKLLVFEFLQRNNKYRFIYKVLILILDKIFYKSHTGVSKSC